IDIAERAIGLLVIELLIKREERIAEDAVLAGRRGVRNRHHVAAVHARHRIQPRLVIELRRRPEEPEQETVGVVPTLREVPARIRVREVAAEGDALRQPVRRVESHRSAVEEIVRSDEHALVMVVVARQIEGRAVVATARRDDVVHDVAGVEGLAAVIVRWAARPSTPATSWTTSSRRAVATT